MSRIDTPLLDNLGITSFRQLIFDTPQLTQFISRTPSLKTRGKARIVFSPGSVAAILPLISPWSLKLEISCGQSDWQLSSLAQIYLPLPQALIPTMEHLYIRDELLPPHWQDDIEDGQVT